MKKFFAFSMCADFSAHVKREMSTSVCFFFSPATIYFVLFFLYFSFVFFFCSKGKRDFCPSIFFSPCTVVCLAVPSTDTLLSENKFRYRVPKKFCNFVLFF